MNRHVGGLQLRRRDGGPEYLLLLVQLLQLLLQRVRLMLMILLFQL